jgi:outer membrane beta-barrel protein
VENWFRSIFLILLLFGLTLPVVSRAADETESEEDAEEQSSLVQPQIERIEFDESKIDADDFEFTVFTGMLSIEDFGVNTISGFKLAYHVNESFFVQAEVGESDAGETSFEVLNGGAPLLSDDERALEYYQFNVGYNLFPGEAFLTDETTLNNTFYLIAGIGDTEFAGDDRYTINYGFGYRLIFWDYMAFTADLRDYVFYMDVFGEEEETHNIAYTFALSLYF